MPYPPRQIPDAPLPMSMAPQAETLTGNDIVVIVQPLNAPGQKTRSMTLSQFASFIAAGELGEIVFVNVNGFRSTVGKNGYSYHHDADQSDNTSIDYAIDSNGIHAVHATSGYVMRFETNGYKVLFSKTNTIYGLTDKVEIFENYIQISHQTRNGANVITHTSRIAWDHMRTPEVRVMQDENNYIPISWDSTNNEFVIWQRANSGTVAVPKLHVYGTLQVEKDTTIDADVNITKTLTVTQTLTVGGRADLNGIYTVIKNLFATEHTELKGISKMEMNMSSGAIVKCSENQNPTLSSSAAVGTRVIVLNDTEENQTVTFGNYVTTLYGHNAMEFLRASDGASGWFKIG